METLWQDFQFAVRMMLKNPGFTVAAVLCLMLGIGATTGIFTVVNAVLLQPLPYSHPEQLVRVYTEFPAFPNGGLHRFWTSGPEFLELRRDTHSWASLDAWITGGANLAGKTQPVRVTAANVSGGLLESLAVAPVAGRLISPSDDVPGAPVVADISYGTWQSVFAGDPKIVGRETYLDGLKCTIIGVMPKGFQFRQPAGEGNSDMYVVMRPQSGDPRSLVGVVRQQLNAIDPSLPLADVRLMEDVLSRAQSRPRFLTLLLSLFSIVALAIATVGIYGVVSYSVARRTKEFGLRMVLGAQSEDVLGLVMKQGASMVAIGIVAGLATAFALTRLMASLLFGVTATDLPTFAGVTVVLLTVALAACYLPALRATRVDPIQTLRYE